MTCQKIFATIKKTIGFLSLVMVITAAQQSIGIVTAYAKNLELVGDTSGLKILDEGTFDISNMLPGESRTTGIKIRNLNNYAFTLSAEWTGITAPAENELSFLNALDITVFMNGQKITDFPINGGSRVLCKLVPNQTALLDLDITLGNVGNEYQGLGSALQLIFRASSEGSNPDGPDRPGRDRRGGSSSGGSSSGVESSDGYSSDENTSAVTEPELTITELVTIDDNSLPLFETDLHFEEDSPEESVPVEMTSPVTGIDEAAPDESDELIGLTNGSSQSGLLKLPQTGEISLLYYALAGCIAIGLGIAFLLAGRKNKTKHIK